MTEGKKTEFPEIDIKYISIRGAGGRTKKRARREAQSRPHRQQKRSNCGGIANFIHRTLTFHFNIM